MALTNILFFFFLQTAFAQSNQDAVRHLGALQNPGPEVTCPSLITPREAMTELNNPVKTFIGRRNLYGHDQNYTCIYKTSRAYVLYHNCMGSKKEYNALDFEVIPFEGNIIGFSMENNNLGVPSTLRRSDYNMNWSVSFEVTNPPGGNLNADQLNTFLSSNSRRGSCFIGSTFKAKDLTQRASCSSVPVADTSVWEEEATSFWREPGEEWYRAIKESRKRMTSF